MASKAMLQGFNGLYDDEKHRMKLWSNEENTFSTF
jgi:hypothetical protein